MRYLKRIFTAAMALVLVLLMLPVTPLSVARPTQAQAATNPYPSVQYVEGVQTLPCTRYAWQQAYDRLGVAMPNWGDAINWYNSAANAGFPVGTTPQPNSIAVWSMSSHSYGHVAFVTAVNGSQMTINEGGRTDQPGNNGVVNGQQAPSTVGYTWWDFDGRTLIGFIYLDGNENDAYTYQNVSGEYYLMNHATGKYLAVDGGVDAHQQNISVATYTGGNEMKFQISAAKNGCTLRPLCSSSRVVNPDGTWISGGLNVNLYTNENDVTQWWGFELVSDGLLPGYVIRNIQNPNCVLDLSGNNVIVSSYTGAASQIWSLRSLGSVTELYTVTYDANGGTGAPASQTKVGDITLKLSSQEPTKTGYDFMGWSTSKTGEAVLFLPGDNYILNADRTLYAVWKKAVYTVTYNTGKGSGAPDSQKAEYGETIRLSDKEPVCYGFHFAGWSTDSNATTAAYQPGDSFVVRSNTTLYAVWITCYNIRYDSNGGTGGPVEEKKVPGQPLTLTTEVPARDGYIFKGWATDSYSETAAYQPGDLYTNDADIFLYAVWIPEYETGECGENLTYSLDNKTGTLTISGTGAMYEWMNPESWEMGRYCPWVDNTNIKKLVIEDGVTSIGSYSFYRCEGLEFIEIPDSVTKIGRQAFFSTAISSIYISENVTEIGQAAFENCHDLEYINVDPNNANYACDMLGCLFNKDYTTLMAVPMMISGSFTIREGVTTIDHGAFWNHYNLTAITVPNTVKSIGGGAFGYCTGLTSITVPDSVTTLGTTDGAWKGVFQGCSGLTSVTLGNNIEAISDNAFSDCDSLTSVIIPDSVMTIGTEAFCGCDMLESVVIGSGVTTIGSNAFYECCKLNNISIPNSVKTLAPYVFYGCTCLSDIAFSNSLTSVGAYALAETAWYDNQPDGLIYTGKLAYQYKGTCPATVTIKDGTLGIADNAFMDCTNMTTVTIPDSVITIGEYAFYGCNGLTSVTIPDSVTTIGTWGFAYCQNLETITVSDKAIDVGWMAFDGTGWYEAQPEGVVHLGKMAIGSKGEQEHVSVQEGTLSITNGAFRDSIFTSITLPESLTRIDAAAFGDSWMLEAIVIPKNVESIGDGAFMGIASLKEITFTGDAPVFGDDVFSTGVWADNGCVTATAYYPANNPTWTEEVRQNYGGNITWIAYDGGPEDDGPEIIADGTCGNNLTWTLDSEGLLTISGTGAMYDWAYRSSNAPWYDEFWEDIKIVVIEDGVTTIGNDAFIGCVNLTTVTIPGSVRTIGNNAFDCCYSLTSVTIPDGVTTIGSYAFYCCYRLTSVTIPNSISTIDYNAFELCTSLTSVTIPKSVTTMGKMVFAQCSALTTVTFEGGIEDLGSVVFFGVTATVYYPANDPTWTETVRQNCGGDITWVPYGETKPEKFDIDVARMTLGNSLEFQFGVAKTKLEDVTGVYAVVEKGDVTKTIPATQWGSVGQYYAIVYDGLAAKEMADEISVTIYNADGQAISNVKTDSVRAYVARAFAGQTAAGKTMMVDMLNYGAAAQVKFNYNTGDLANNQLTDAQKACGTATLTATENIQVKGPNYMGTRLVLESRIQMQVAFSGMTQDMYAIYSYTDHNGTEQNVTVQGTDFISVNGMYGIELDQLVYADTRSLVTVRVYNADGTLYSGAKDSIQSYVNRSGETDPLFNALIKFTDSAKAYLH